ncbi:MAG: hypothetical protein Ct9H300mP14_14120 [Gammaproteobacteria bacterium]|nr:MAG: hypothetical protein Ct9H300mP14_14120 [Gammaproteobacteria bacterium]
MHPRVVTTVFRPAAADVLLVGGGFGVDQITV